MAGGFRDNARSIRNARRGLFFATLIAILIVLLNIASGGSLSALARIIAQPISSIGTRIGSGITQNGYFTTRESLESQIAALQAEVQQDQLQSAAYADLEQQNQSLSSLVHLAQTTPGLAAPVISSVISSPYGTFMIGAGSADNISVGSLVLISGNFVIGKVAELQAHQAVVEEVAAPGEQTPVLIDGAAVIAAGQGGQLVAQVPHGIAVAVGDPVTAPGFNARPVGIVQHVDNNPANAQQAVYIAPPVSLASIEYVYVTP